MGAISGHTFYSYKNIAEKAVYIYIYIYVKIT